MMGLFDARPTPPDPALAALREEVTALRGELAARNAQWDVLMECLGDLQALFVTMTDQVRQHHEANREAAERARPLIVLAHSTGDYQ